MRNNVEATCPCLLMRHLVLACFFPTFSCAKLVYSACVRGTFRSSFEQTLYILQRPIDSKLYSRPFGQFLLSLNVCLIIHPFNNFLRVKNEHLYRVYLFMLFYFIEKKGSFILYFRCR